VAAYRFEGDDGAKSPYKQVAPYQCHGCGKRVSEKPCLFCASKGDPVKAKGWQSRANQGKRKT